MNKNKKEKIEYTEEIQEYYLSFLMSNEDAFARCRSVIDPAYFNSRLRSTVRFMLEYSDEYKAVPSKEQIQAKCSITLDNLDLDKTQRNHADWFLDEFEGFCKHKALEGAIEGSIDKIDNGEYGDVEQRIKDAVLVGLQKDLGTSFFDKPKETLERLRSNESISSTGWKDIDRKLFGGFNRKELNIFAASSGVGKSLFLQNLGLNWVQQGLNVIYISLELSEELLHHRLSAMISGYATKDVFRNLDDVEMKIVMGHKKHNWGEFQLKYMPTGSTTNDIKVYLKEYEIQTGIKPDAVLVDYLDLVHPNNNKVNPSDMFVKDKYVSEELRGLAAEWNLLFATASQLNRGAMEEQEHEMHHIAGGLSKINTADNVMTIFSSEVLKSRGEFRVQFIKTRSSSGVGSKVFLAFDIDSLRITDMSEDASYEKKDITEVGSSLKRQSNMTTAPPERNENGIDQPQSISKIQDKIGGNSARDRINALITKQKQ